MFLLFVQRKKNSIEYPSKYNQFSTALGVGLHITPLFLTPPPPPGGSVFDPSQNSSLHRDSNIEPLAHEENILFFHRGTVTLFITLFDFMCKTGKKPMQITFCI